jgi:hypothetical protein
MNAFFADSTVLSSLQCVRWYGKYAISVCLEHTNSDGGVELCER